MVVEKTRHFGGLLWVPPDMGKKRSPKNRFDKNLHEKHLRAYLRGDTRFIYKGHWFPVFAIWK